MCASTFKKRDVYSVYLPQGELQVVVAVAFRCFSCLFFLLASFLKYKLDVRASALPFVDYCIFSHDITNVFMLPTSRVTFSMEAL